MQGVAANLDPGGYALTEAEIILMMVKALTVFVAVMIFIHFLCDEYLRALELRGLIRRRTKAKEAAPADVEPAKPPAKTKP